MKTSITFRHLEPTEALKNFVGEKIAKIEKHLIKPQDVEVHVILSLERYLHKAEVSVQESHFSAVGKDESDNMYASIERAIEKAGKALKKHKDKIKNPKHHDVPDVTAAD